MSILFCLSELIVAVSKVNVGNIYLCVLINLHLTLFICLILCQTYSNVMLHCNSAMHTDVGVLITPESCITICTHYENHTLKCK